MTNLAGAYKGFDRSNKKRIIIFSIVNKGMDEDNERAARAQLCVLQLRSFHLHFYYDEIDGLIGMIFFGTQRIGVIFFRRVMMAVIQTVIQNGDCRHSSV